MIVWSWYERRRLKLLANGLAGEILDVGFADCPNAFFDNSATVTGIDLVEADPVLGYSRQVVGDLHDCVELSPTQFDAVVAGEVLEHVEDPYGFLHSLWDRLKPKGVLRLSTPNPLGFPVLFFEMVRSERRFFSDDHMFYFNPRWVVRMLQHTGFEEISLKSVGVWLPGVPLPYSPISMSYQIVYSAIRPG